MTKPNKYLIFALTLAVINLIVVFIIFDVAKIPETLTMINATHWMSGTDYNPELIWSAVTRPLAPLLAVPFEILGEGAGLIIQSLVFYLLCVYFIFKITDLIYKNKLQALSASILYAFAIPALQQSVSFQATNAGSWFFCIFSIYLTLLYLKKRDEKLIIFNGLICGFGVLMKESGGLGILFFAVIILFSKEFGFKDRVLKIIKFGAFSLVPIIPWETFLLIFTPFSHFKFLSHVKTVFVDEGPTRTFYNALYLLSLFITFGLLGWALALWGAFKEWKNKNKKRTKILLALVPFSFISFAWPAADPRHIFIVATLVVLLASYGLINIKNIFKNKKIGFILIAIILIIYIVFNYYSYYIDDSLPFIDFENLLNFLKISS